MAMFRVRCTLGNIDPLITKLDVEFYLNGIQYTFRLDNDLLAQNLGVIPYTGTTLDFYGVYHNLIAPFITFFRNGDVLRVRIRQGVQYNSTGATAFSPWVETNYTIANGALVAPNTPTLTASPQVTLVLGTPTLTARVIFSNLDPGIVKFKYSVIVNNITYPGETNVIIDTPVANTIDVTLYNVATPFVVNDAVQFLGRVAISDGMGGLIYCANFRTSNVIRIGWVAPPTPAALTNTMSAAAV